MDISVNARVAGYHPDFRFPNADVLLVCDETGFKVHKNMLKRVSEVFFHLFSDPATKANRSFRGLPVVPMHGDLYEDVELFLRIIYFAADWVDIKFEKDTARHFLRAIRISSKYGVEFIRDHFLKIILQSYPTSYEDIWPLSHMFLETSPDPLDVLRIAEHAESRNLIRTCLYLIAYHTKTRRLNGKLAFIIEGKKRVDDKCWDILTHWKCRTIGPKLDCWRSGRCKHAFRNHVGKFKRHSNFDLFIIFNKIAWDSDEDLALELCPVCRPYYLGKTQAWARAFWDNDFLNCFDI
ncbi:hypothetical protein M422DRAFT_257399 [Sphaerobolus stellatus SS14]|uniref:BTB domain-containing protein n=1 Tax=Sphaerobolus stellatus (strain SS14) TaxID=990650 RepID=A0A0C9VEH5_SPHS4|nr:hypothetical protein M422DRAFT_257399 [Sphaerobolus stellatus SS14]